MKRRVVPHVGLLLRVEGELVEQPLIRHRRSHHAVGFVLGALPGNGLTRPDVEGDQVGRRAERRLAGCAVEAGRVGAVVVGPDCDVPAEILAGLLAQLDVAGHQLYRLQRTLDGLETGGRVEVLGRGPWHRRKDGRRLIVQRDDGDLVVHVELRQCRQCQYKCSKEQCDCPHLLPHGGLPPLE